MDIDYLEFYSPNGDINKFDRIIQDYFSKREPDSTFFLTRDKPITSGSDEPARKIKKAIVVKVATIALLPRWTIDVTSEELNTSVAFLRFDEFPNFCRIRFDIIRQQYHPIVKEIAEQIITKLSVVGFNILPLDWKKLEDSRQLRYSKKGMSPRRRARATLFKQIKDKNPGFSKSDVAVQAIAVAFDEIRHEIRENNTDWDDEKVDRKVISKFREKYHSSKDWFSEDDVKNDFRTMGWTWIDSRNIS